MRYILIILFLFNVASAQSLFGVVASDGGLDSNAVRFFDSASITDATQRRAVNYLCKALKANSLWDKGALINPFVGGTSSSHAFNLKNVAKYKITWSGSVTHNSNGITGAGGHGLTGLVQTSESLTTQNSVSYVYWSRTSSQDGGFEFGSFDGSNQSFSQARDGSNRALNALNDGFTVIGAGGSMTDGSGFYVHSRTASNNSFISKNGSTYQTSTVASTGNMSAQIALLGRFRADLGGTVDQLSSRNLSFFWIGSGLSTTEAATLYTIIQNFQSILGR